MDSILSQLGTYIATRLKEVAETEKADFAAAQAYTDGQIADLVGGAPEQLDTLKELADAYSDNASLIEALNDAVTNHVHGIATDASNGFMSTEMVKLLSNCDTGLSSLEQKVDNFFNELYYRDNVLESSVSTLRTRCTNLESRCTTLESVLTYFMPATTAAQMDETENA